MQRSAWRAPTTFEVVKRRVGGRRHVNSVKQFRAKLRRRQVLALLHELGWARGTQAQIARRLQTSPATISRDLAVILPLFRECRHCGQLRPRDYAADEED